MDSSDEYKKYVEVSIYLMENHETNEINNLISQFINFELFIINK